MINKKYILLFYSLIVVFINTAPFLLGLFFKVVDEVMKSKIDLSPVPEFDLPIDWNAAKTYVPKLCHSKISFAYINCVMFIFSSLSILR